MRQFLGNTAGTAVHDCELSLLTANGTAVPVSLNCTPRYSAVGKMLGMVMTGRPVGELRRAYQALHKTHEELKLTQQQLLHSEKMASLGRLVAGVAHELNNPISFVLGNVHALRKYADRLNRYLAAIHAQPLPAAVDELRHTLRIDRITADLESLIEGTVEGAERTRDIVDGLKRFSALDRGQMECFNLVDTIERAVHWVTRNGSGHFSVTMVLPPQIEIKGSPGRLQQVIMNLVENAYDATLGIESPQLTIRSAYEGDKILIRFEDNGSGIATANLSKIFDPFFTTKPVGKGTGLGLAISYGIVERHGGELSASNRPEGGAVFVLKLPV
jgi:two-component system sensor histidine kinase HupT/HoxJ